ncbi:MAG TPA: choice-of-anchor tandem repeat GloVer-containing protein [Bryobacteraceae bacterium]|nr:choice-of-anchor tandem repeat GloVer-containing protein [Bryobacteraceae bacterium]
MKGPTGFIVLSGVLLGALEFSAEPAAAQAQFTIVYSFRGYPSDGAIPIAPLVLGGQVFYGTTFASGDTRCGCGAVFSLTPPATAGGAWIEEILHKFAGYGDGATPESGLTLSADGVLYGTTDAGGNLNLGTVYSMTPPASPGGSWTETILHSFGANQDGANPVGGLVIGLSGALYGTTWSGGQYNGGTVFALFPPASPGGVWTEQVLYNFTGGLDGRYPQATLAIDPASGTLYGTTTYGGSSLDGVAFMLTPPGTPGGAWAETVLHNFTGGIDGLNPNSLVLGSKGVVYGTSHGVPGVNLGAVYSLSPPQSSGSGWAIDVLHDFFGGADGSQPAAGLLIGANNVLYGTTTGGGGGPCQGGCGTVFSLTAPAIQGGAWTEAVVHSFGGTSSVPSAPLVTGQNGAMYSTAKYGGARGVGAVYSVLLP